MTTGNKLYTISNYEDRVKITNDWIDKYGINENAKKELKSLLAIQGPRNLYNIYKDMEWKLSEKINFNLL